MAAKTILILCNNANQRENDGVDLSIYLFFRQKKRIR